MNSVLIKVAMDDRELYLKVKRMVKLTAAKLLSDGQLQVLKISDNDYNLISPNQDDNLFASNQDKNDLIASNQDKIV